MHVVFMSPPPPPKDFTPTVKPHCDSKLCQVCKVVEMGRGLRDTTSSTQCRSAA